MSSAESPGHMQVPSSSGDWLAASAVLGLLGSVAIALTGGRITDPDVGYLSMAVFAAGCLLLLLLLLLLWAAAAFFWALVSVDLRQGARRQMGSEQPGQQDSGE